MFRRTTVALAVVAAALGALAPTTPAYAALTFGPPRTAVAPACAASGSTGLSDSAYGAGRLRGFASFNNAACGDRIYYFEGGSQGYTRVATPYKGLPLGVAADSTATYLLYMTLNANGDPAGIGVTKRTHSRHYFPTRVLSTAAGGQVVIPTGDIAAVGGHWWAVWTQQVGPGGEFAHEQLFEAKTFGTARNPHRLTSTPSNVSDTEPSIALDANGAVLAWTRQTSPAADGPSDVWVAVDRDIALERARAFSTVGTHDSTPDVQRIVGVTMLAWTRDGKIVESDNSTGTFRSHQFLVGGDFARVSESTGSFFVAWTANPGIDASARVFFARGNKGSNSFEGGFVSPAGTALESVVGLHGKATVFIRSFTRVYSVTGS